MWIADIGVIVYNAPHMQGIVKLRKPSPNNNIMIGNGESMKIAIIGNMKGTIINKHGQLLMKVILHNIVYIPQL